MTTTDVDSAVIEALWAKVEENLRADAPHQAFLEQCARSERLLDAAKRYRQVRDGLDDEELRALIDRRLAAIATLAMAQIDAHRTAPRPKRSRGWLILAAALVSVGSGALLLWAIW